MKIYTASKFSIVIVPPNLSEKTKESKLLVRSFRNIYKVAGFGIATGLSGLISLSQFQNKTIPADDFTNNSDISFIEKSAKSMPSFQSDESVEFTSTSSPITVESELDNVAKRSVDVLNDISNSEIIGNSDFFLPFVIITIILGGLAAYYLWQFRKFNLT